MVWDRGDGVSTDTGWSPGRGVISHPQVKLIPLNYCKCFRIVCGLTASGP